MNYLMVIINYDIWNKLHAYY